MKSVNNNNCIIYRVNFEIFRAIKMSDQEDLFEAKCVNSAKVNRRALKRKAKNIANTEIKKLIAQKEKVACESEIQQGNALVPGGLCDLNSQVYIVLYLAILFMKYIFKYIFYLQTSSMLLDGSNILQNETEAISNPDSSSNALLETAFAGFPMSPFHSAVESIDSSVINFNLYIFSGYIKFYSNLTG